MSLDIVDLGIDGNAGRALRGAGYTNARDLRCAEFRELAGIVGEADAGRIKLAVDDSPLADILNRLATAPEKGGVR